MALDAVLLDLDGTVLDTHDLILSSWRHVRDRYALAATDDAFRRGMGRPLEEVLGGFARHPSEVTDLVAAYREHNALHHDAMVRPFPGMAEAIAELRGAGIRVAIVTSKSRPFAERGLGVAGIVVDAVVGPKDAARPKPAPDPVWHALGQLGATADRAVMVGDAPSDLLAGRAAGVRTAAVPWGAFSRAELEPLAPDHWLVDAQDLVRLARSPVARG